MALCVKSEFPEKSPGEGLGKVQQESLAFWRCQHGGIITTTVAAWSAARMSTENKLYALQRVELQESSRPLEDARHWALSYLYN